MNGNPTGRDDSSLASRCAASARRHAARDSLAGSPQNAPTEFIRGLSPGGGGNLPDFISSLIPPAGQQPGNNVDNSFHLSIGDTKADTGDVMTAMDDYYLQHTRTGLRNVPSP